MKNHLLFKALALVACLSCALGVSAYDYYTSGTGLYYNFTGDNTAEVTYATTDYNSYSGDIIIPTHFRYGGKFGEDYYVTAIGPEAFKDSRNMTSVDIANTVTSIGYNAFEWCSGLTNIILPNSVTTIDSFAFNYCTSLSSITLSSSLTSIGWGAFGDCALSSINIPASVQWMGDNPFFDCASLASITVNSSNSYFTAVNSVLFDKAKTRLICYPAGKTATSYTVPGTVTSIDQWGIRHSKLQSLTLPASLTTIRSMGLSYNYSLTQVTCLALTPPTVSSDCFYATINNSGLKLIVPAGCKSAYQAATGWNNFSTIEEMPYSFEKNGFYYKVTGTNTVSVTYKKYFTATSSYTGSLTIPSTVTFNGKTYQVTGISNYAFCKCGNLTSVYIPNSVTSVGYGAFEQCSGLTQVRLPDGLTKISDGLFSGCSALPSVDIPNSVTVIRGAAFLDCSSLRSIRIPETQTTLYESTFSNCSSLTEVTIPDAVTTVDAFVFDGCSSLTTVTIGRGMTTLGGEYVFGDCNSLRNVTCLATTPPTLDPDVFNNSHYSNVTLTVPKGCKSAYQSANYWKDFTTIKELAYSFEKDGIYYNITGNNKVSVTYKDTGYHSYSGSVTIPSTVSYGGKTYQVTAIGDWAFAYCWDLTSVTIGNKVASIGDEAFENCTGLTSVTIPNSVLTIGSRAFCNSWRISELTIGNSVISIGSSAFGSCSALTSVTIPNSVTSIGDEAFSYCYDMVSVVIGSSVSTIGAEVFQDIQLQNITCLAVIPPTIQYSTFRDYQYSTATLYVPAVSKNAYQTANHWKNFTHIMSIGSPGDMNGDDVLDVSDVTALISMVLGSTPANPAVGDMNGDSVVDVADVIVLIALALSN